MNPLTGYMAEVSDGRKDGKETECIATSPASDHIPQTHTHTHTHSKVTLAEYHKVTLTQLSHADIQISCNIQYHYGVSALLAVIA